MTVSTKPIARLYEMENEVQLEWVVTLIFRPFCIWKSRRLLDSVDIL